MNETSYKNISCMYASELVGLESSIDYTKKMYFCIKIILDYTSVFT